MALLIRPHGSGRFEGRRHPLTLVGWPAEPSALRPMLTKLLRTASLLVPALCACQSGSALFEPVRAADMQEAGSVHVAVLAVAPWSDYASALQPDFTLTADSAVGEVARDSRWQGQQTFSGAHVGADSTLLSVQNGSPTALEPARPNGGNGPAGGGATFPAPPSSGSLGASGETPAIGPDSMLKYTAATALYQEVQLLNRHIRDAAIPAGFRPYMVRLQLSLMPSRRHAPYDTYTTLSFFVPGERGTRSEAGAPLLTTSDAIFQRPFGNGPKVLPLVVTDNLEASVQSRSYERIRGLTASLVEFEEFSIANGATSFVGDLVKPMFSAMLAKALRDEVYGRDLNSLLTMARLSENTLRIRLGAMQEGTSDYAMVPRNHNITLLLMVPEDAPPLVEVVARTLLVDTEDGVPLAAPDERDKVERLQRLQKEWGLKGLELENLVRLHGFAQQNDQEGFAALLRSALPDGHPTRALERSLWIELVGMKVGEQYSSNLFELPGQGQDVELASAVFSSQTVVVEDNGEFAYVTLREARFPESERLLAVLRSPAPAPSGEEESGIEREPAPEALVLPAESIKADVSRREVRLRFPSLLRWGLAEDRAVLDLDLSWAGHKQVFPARLCTVVESGVAEPLQRRALEPRRDFESPFTGQENQR